HAHRHGGGLFAAVDGKLHAGFPGGRFRLSYSPGGGPPAGPPVGAHRQRMKPMLDEDETEELGEPGPQKFIKAALVGPLEALVVIFLAWLWWQGQENKPFWQVERMLQEEQKK